jgi:hypothetical protein
MINICNSNGDTTGNATQQQLLQVLAYNDSIAKAMCMLVKLKDYLKKVYSLKDKACYSYNPSDKADIRSTAITPVRPLELLASPSKSSENKGDTTTKGTIKAYAEQYEQLKRQLDNDTSDSMYNNSSSGATKQPEDDDVTDDIQRYVNYSISQSCYYACMHSLFAPVHPLELVCASLGVLFVQGIHTYCCAWQCLFQYTVQQLKASNKACKNINNTSKED